METTEYLSWLARSTPTAWWHDSGDPDELEQALSRGAVGVTTNPVLAPQALTAHADRWADEIGRAVRDAPDAKAKAESLMRIVVAHAAGRLGPAYARTAGAHGYVCAQVDPSLAGDRDAMYAMGRRFAAWAPNIAVKLPVTAAGLDVLERLCAEGITVTATVSFTVAQVMAVAERYEKALKGRGAAGSAGRCFAVLMVGRLDDYLREVFCDARAGIADADLQLAGLAVAKHAYALYRQRGYAAKLMIAAFRQTRQVVELSGADAVLSIHPRYQKLLGKETLPREQGIGREVDPDALRRLSGQEGFLRAFNADGLAVGELISYGLTQRTLSQFTESGWKQLEQFAPPRAGG
jgi:transaldolase